MASQPVGPDPEVIAKIQARYGEDLADAIDYALWLYNNPDIEEDPDYGEPGYFDSQSQWNLVSFLMAAGNTLEDARRYAKNMRNASGG